MLRRMSSVQLISFGKTGGMFAASNRGMVNGSIYPMNVMVDGVMMATPMDGPFDVAKLPPPDEIHGIEVFAGGAPVPVQYGGAGNNKWCGLIAI
jgi:TonB-dependent Receptor Plug Domain